MALTTIEGQKKTVAAASNWKAMGVVKRRKSNSTALRVFLYWEGWVLRDAGLREVDDDDAVKLYGDGAATVAVVSTDLDEWQGVEAAAVAEGGVMEGMG
ncbi:uncharacterized protein DS421_3g106160 [Arachis hypogaea]|nr:uncharacterized protein DS421_3g106160 [Arachis hypogaea]